MTEKLYQDNYRTIYCGDSRQMIELADESVQCVVTSPPYWGLRKYSGEQELIWGDNHCGHQWSDYRASLIHENRNFQRGTQEEVIAEGRELTHIHKYSDLKAGFCSLCGAWKGAFGLEPTPEMYVQHTIEILREIRRVLRKDGVVFLNLGDSYAGSGKGQNADGSPSKSGKLQQSNRGTQVGGMPVSRFDKWNSDTQGSIQVSHNTPKAHYKGLKPKDLCLIPFRIAIAAQEDGWWVRSVIIWNKPNPMPESVTDRPTESHEYILMLTKSKKYYWDADAVREQATRDWGNTGGSLLNRTGWATSAGRNDDTRQEGTNADTTSRNLRSVWTFPTQPYPDAHFAVFPEKLPELCIKAATAEAGCCSKCGVPLARITRKGSYEKHETENRDLAVHRDGANRSKHALPVQTETLTWQPSCKCNADKAPSVVLDPFMGAGTTLLVAAKLGRKAIGYDLSEDYCRLAIERNRQMAL